MSDLKLVFTYENTGHHVEYVNHIIHGVYREGLLNNYVFLLNKKAAQEINSKLPEDQLLNLKIDIIPTKDLHTIIEEKNFLIRSFKTSILLRRYIIKHNVNKVFLISLIQSLPFISLVLPKNVKIIGIIYLIYLYRWKESGFITKLTDVLKYRILVDSKKISSVLILNDTSSVKMLNRLYKTKKFRSLVDPVNLDSKTFSSGVFIQNEKLRNECVIGHFGFLEKRKGTLELLKAIPLIDRNKLENFTFLIAGEVSSEIMKEYNSLLKRAKKFARIETLNKRLNQTEIDCICRSSNYLIIPYTNNQQSSGILGYSAYYSTPVIGPSKGLLGKLIRKYKLGITIEECDSKSIKKILESDLLLGKNMLSEKYLKRNSIMNFNTRIIKELNQ